MVKCADCGFLAIRLVSTGQLGEVNRDYEGKVFFDIFDTHGVPPIFGNAPICFARKYDLVNEYFLALNEKRESKFNSTDLYLLVQGVLWKERVCDGFTKWQTGFTAKEIQEMMDREKREKWQADREDADRKWHSQQVWKLLIISIIGAGFFTLLGAIIARFFNNGH